MIGARMSLLGFPLFPDTASTIAVRVNHLLYYLLAVSGTFSIGILIAIVYFAIRYRRRPGNEVATQVLGSHRLEVAWTAGPFLLLLVMYAWGADVYFTAYAPPRDALEIAGVGKQWMWKFQHLSGQREIDTLHVPVGRPVKVLLTSQDVIHSFFVPAFRVKQDAIPGRYSEVWFEATQAGTYHLFCAEYCGTLHSGMIGSVVALEPADFQQWLAGSATLSPAQRGQKLFQDLGCNTCHRSDALARAPDLVGLFGRTVRLRGGGTVVADEGYIRESIVDPGAKLVDGYENLMPTFTGQVTEEGILDLIAYVRSLGTSEVAAP